MIIRIVGGNFIEERRKPLTIPAIRIETFLYAHEHILQNDLCIVVFVKGTGFRAAAAQFKVAGSPYHGWSP
jgi:hypothetical protein